jgi:hypothetical protein
VVQHLDLEQLPGAGQVVRHPDECRGGHFDSKPTGEGKRSKLWRAP